MNYEYMTKSGKVNTASVVNQAFANAIVNQEVSADIDWVSDGRRIELVRMTKNNWLEIPNNIAEHAITWDTDYIRERFYTHKVHTGKKNELVRMFDLPKQDIDTVHCITVMNFNGKVKCLLVSTDDLGGKWVILSKEEKKLVSYNNKRIINL